MDEQALSVYKSLIGYLKKEAVEREDGIEFEFKGNIRAYLGAIDSRTGKWLEPLSLAVMTEINFNRIIFDADKGLIFLIDEYGENVFLFAYDSIVDIAQVEGKWVCVLNLSHDTEAMRFQVELSPAV